MLSFRRTWIILAAFIMAIAAPAGTLSTLAGGIGDGGPATQALLESAADVCVGPGGEIYIADYGAHRVREVALIR